MLIDRLRASFDTGDFVDVRLIGPDVGGVTSRDVVLALTISEPALAAGATPHPELAAGLR